MTGPPRSATSSRTTAGSTRLRTSCARPTEPGYGRQIKVQANLQEGRYARTEDLPRPDRAACQHYQDGVEDQLAALGLVLHAVVLWNTRYLDAAVARLRAEGHDIKDEDVARLSPLKDRHINFYLDDFSVGEGLLVEASRPQHAGDQAPVGTVRNRLSSVVEVAVHVAGPGAECFEVAVE
ncbi:Tn3 family transposase [Streptomyces sp. NPDC056638]|uniref:Tn3 family transposase n=1 Tax=Streptomyces sp. NPDC056638 TaxID=3345887 RepID=UPI0036ACD834